MATQDETRGWKGSILSVRNADDSAWIAFANCIDYSMPDTERGKIDANTAEAEVDQFRLDLPDRGQAVFNVFDNLDSLFLQAMNTMRTNGETRKFKLVMPEGTNRVRVFYAYVLDAPINGTYRQLWKMTLTLRVNRDTWWNAVLAAASLTPTSGSAAGGTSVTVTGNGFIDGKTSVTIGGNPVAAEDVTVNSATSLTFVTPAHAAGAVTVTVTSPEGTTSNISGGYTYS